MSDCGATIEPVQQVTNVTIERSCAVEPVRHVTEVEVQRAREVEIPRGPRGRDGLNINPYTHTQSSASVSWTVAHNLGYHPVVAIETPGGLEMIGEVLHQSNNLLTISFASARAGTARCL
jgi:hypothetical protein